MDSSRQFSQIECQELEQPVITELNRVLGQELDEVGAEQRFDLAYEVTETVRYEQADFLVGSA